MGNLCGKQSKDAFDGPGRTLGSAPAPATKASVPVSAATASSKSTPPKRTVGGPPRTLGESNATEHAGRAAADAAEARANKTPTGALQKKLDAQKRQTHAGVLKTASEQERIHRDIKDATDARAHN
ncbi:hypothetical protein SVAN01_08785 [Stagonosporopsis vannaccii]|nr:hypothetical protein SVAN01_08785 [Stagonosporopsis vannaccii]